MSYALYFPKLSLPDSTWVHPAILFFEGIQVIAPLHAGEALYDRRTEQLIDAGVVQPIVPGIDEWDGEADERFVDAMTRLPSARRRQTEPTSVHIGKLAYTRLGGILRDEGLFQPERDGWFQAERWAADEVLTYLALQLSLQSPQGVSLVTDTGPAWTRATGLSIRERKEGRRLAAAAALLPVASNARIPDLLRFRRRHDAALSEFREHVETLIQDQAQGQAGEYAFVRRLEEAERRRDDLIRELDAFDLVSLAIQTTISASPLGAALAEGSPWSAGAGFLALAATAWDVGERAGRAFNARRDPLVYAAIAKLKLAH